VSNAFIASIVAALDAAAPSAIADRPALAMHDAGELPAWFAVTDLASASIGSAVAEIAALATHPPTEVRVDSRLASLWFAQSMVPTDFQLPSPWDAIAGDYRTSDGWIKLHTNAPHHRAAALSVLEAPPERERVAQAVQGWQKADLELAVVAAGGCAAAMHSREEWQTHPQGAAVAAEPLIGWHGDTTIDPKIDPTVDRQPPASAPNNLTLTGVRVLDLTRVLAGPVASRTLARFGAQVLRIDPPDWEEPGVVPEVTLGKRCAGLDLHRTSDRERFEQLLQSADVLLSGYRPGALDGLGYDRGRTLALNPALIDVRLNAYGWSGPWQNRRGFDSLVQMSCGINDHGRLCANQDAPLPLPVQALDHATGYLLAASIARALKLRRNQGLVLSARLSLARTAELLFTSVRNTKGSALKPVETDDLDDFAETTPWGRARRLQFPVQGLRQHWPNGAVALRSSPPVWQSAATPNS